MMPMTLAELARVVGGVVHGDPTVTITGPATVDSRTAVSGGLFVAFEGEHADGHDYADSAAANGAAGVLASRPTSQPTVVVGDTLRALQTLASYVLALLREDLTVIGVTGSQGKTTAKDMLAGVLAHHGPTVAAEGSFNNELGLPLTVLRADAETRYLVLEMGARGVGHIARLCELAPPDVGLVLNVGVAHIGEFGDQASIAAAKAELVEALPAIGVAVLNADDQLVSAMATRTDARVVTFGASPAADVRRSGVVLDRLGRPVFDLTYGKESVHLALKLTGEHQAGNAAAVVATVVGLGVRFGDAAEQVAAVADLSRWRMEVRERADGSTVINDAYNANPDSMRAALQTLAGIGRARGGECRTIAVLGEMRELGASSRDEHDAVGRLAVRLDIGQLVVVGEAARPIHLGAYLEGSWGEEPVFVADNDAALAWLREHVRPGDVVLVKASRGAALESVAEGLLGGSP